MSLQLDKHQLIAIDNLRNGSILNGGVGSGKSRTALAYYFVNIGKGELEINGEGKYKPMHTPKNLYIITTARKRDTLEWEAECVPFLLTTNEKLKGTPVIIDSWNNIKKYTDVEDAFFIFDEQRVVGSGSWSKAFLKIAKKNKWIMLSATPGDTWLDYVPVFIANGFYKNRTEFTTRHVVYNRFVKFPMIERYLETNHLLMLRDKILINMKYTNETKAEYKTIRVKFNTKDYNRLMKDRWNIFKDEPIKNISELCYALRQVINSDKSRTEALLKIKKKHDKIVIFYNFNYELMGLRTMCMDNGIPYAEWNGHKHEPIPKTDTWLYLVQYTAGAEGWNCIETNALVFYSQSYSYKTRIQAAGRIDRRNTPFDKLYYYTFASTASIDLAITKTIDNKKNFNEAEFIKY